MTEPEIKERYFDWICLRIRTDDRDPEDYSEILRYLFDVSYLYSIPMDGNRYEDGIGLRYRFGEETGIDTAVIASMLDIFPCSMLEMMAAMAIRCEEDLMYNPKYGDRTGVWFWHMIDSLGFKDMTDGRVDCDKAAVIVLNFLKHNYKPNGDGSLFRIEDGENKETDMRRMELWYQMGDFLMSGNYI